MQIVKVENMNGTLVTTSNRVAEELGVLHKDLLEKIRVYINKFSSAETSAQFYILSNYKTKDGRTAPNYLITEKGIAQLIGGYSSAVEKAFDLNVAYINKFEEMKQQLQLKAPTTLKEALVLALKQQEEIEQLQGTITVQTQVIEEFRPKKEYLDTILASEGTLCISQIAADYGMSGNKLNSILNQQKIIRKINKQWLLYSEHFE
ncbi:MAG: phage antirepressor KilAC domain-containing protein, partial [Cetobacterium sp.]